MWGIAELQRLSELHCLPQHFADEHVLPVAVSSQLALMSGCSVDDLVHLPPPGCQVFHQLPPGFLVTLKAQLLALVLVMFGPSHLVHSWQWLTEHAVVWDARCETVSTTSRQSQSSLRSERSSQLQILTASAAWRKLMNSAVRACCFGQWR